MKYTKKTHILWKEIGNKNRVRFVGLLAPKWFVLVNITLVILNPLYILIETTQTLRTLRTELGKFSWSQVHTHKHMPFEQVKYIGVVYHKSMQDL